MVELNLYVFVCCGSMSRHLGYAHCIDLHVLLVSVYIFLLCNKKLSYLPHSLDNTTNTILIIHLARSNYSPNHFIPNTIADRNSAPPEITSSLSLFFL